MAIKGRQMGRQVSGRSAPRAASMAAQAAERNGQVPAELWERIARKAYELWEQRGRLDGRDLENWLDAEAIVMDESHEARE